MSTLIISQCDDRLKEKGSYPYTSVYFTRRKGSSHLHELHLLPIICLLNLTFMGPSWRLWPIPIYSERLWKHPSGLDFSSAWSPLSNNWALIPHVMCTCTHAVHKHIRWMKANNLKASRKCCSSQQNVHIKLWHCILAKVQSHPWLKHRDSEMERSKIQ